MLHTYYFFILLSSMYTSRFIVADYRPQYFFHKQNYENSRQDTTKSTGQQIINLNLPMRTKQQQQEYEKRRDLQTLSWVNGKPYHNKTDNECTPDFSCCNKELLASSGERLIFLEAVKQRNQLTIEKMAQVFMERLAQFKGMPAPIFIHKQ